MDDIAVDYGVMYFEFPLWVISHAGGTLLYGGHPDGTVASPIFTDDDLAKTFLEGRRPTTDYVRSVATRDELLSMLVAAEQSGLTHVFVDPGRTVRAHPVSDFRRMLERASTEPPEGHLPG